MRRDQFKMEKLADRIQKIIEKTKKKAGNKKKLPVSTFGQHKSGRAWNKFQILQNGFDHAFMIKGTFKGSYYEKVMVDFMPRCSDRVSIFVSSPNEIDPINDPNYYKIYPVYNKDDRYFSPAFVQGTDLINYREIPFNDLKKFNEKKEMANLQTKSLAKGKKQEILVAKPSSIRCHVCKCQFTDYIEHIESIEHQNLARSSPCCQWIQEFVTFYQQNKTNKLGAKQNQQRTRNHAQNMQISLRVPYSPKKTKKIFKYANARGRSISADAKFTTVSITHVSNSN